MTEKLRMVSDLYRSSVKFKFKHIYFTSIEKQVLSLKAVFILEFEKSGGSARTL